MVMNKKTITITLIILAVLAALYFYQKKKTQPSGDDNEGDDNNGGGSLAWWKVLPSIRWPMAFDNYGKQVGYLQRFLNQKHGFNLSVDAIYGPNTNQAWVTFLGTTGDYASFELDGVDAVYEYQYEEYVKPFESEL